MDPMQPYGGLGRNPYSAIQKANQPKGLQVGPLRSPAKLLTGPLQGNGEHTDVRTLVEYLPRLVRTPKVKKHPFEASASGAKIVVYKGNVLYLRESFTAKPWYVATLAFATEEITLTEAGWLYLVVGIADNEFGPAVDLIDEGVLSSVSQNASTVSLEFSADNPATVADGTGDQIWIPIAQVGFTSGNASVTEQILSYNPMIAFEFLHIVS